MEIQILTDEQLFEGAKSRKQSLFATIISKYAETIEFFIDDLSLDDDMKSNLISEIHILIYRLIENESIDDNFPARLHSIIIKAAQRLFNTHADNLGSALDFIDLIARVEKAKHYLINEEKVEQERCANMAKSAINKAIADMDEDLRVVIKMVEIDGYTWEEIAQKLECPIGTVGSRYFRAREIISLYVKPCVAVRRKLFKDILAEQK